MKSLLATALLAALAPAASQAFDAAPPAAAAPAKADPAAAAKAVLDDLDAGRYGEVHARFSAQMAAAVGTAQLKDVWSSLPQQFGKLQQRGTAHVETQGGMTVVTIPLAFERAPLEAIVATDADGRIAGFVVRPSTAPPPPPRADLVAREVEFAPPHRSALPGTLLMPRGKGPFPVVVLVHGSSPSDRDETVGGTRVFRDIAEGLADRGIATLRYEKRTKQHPTEFTRSYTIDDETTDDAVAAVAFARTQPGIDPKRVFVAGHSQGGMMAPRIAQRAPGLAGIALLAAPARHLQYLVLEQFTYLAKNDPAQGPTLTPQLPSLRARVAELEHIDPKLGGDVPLLNKLPASYWRSLADYDQVDVAARLKMPILLEQGDRDFQVTARDWTNWKRSLGANPKATFHHYPTLNHLFVSGEGLSLPAEYARVAHVDAQPIADLAEWIKAN